MGGCYGICGIHGIREIREIHEIQQVPKDPKPQDPMEPTVSSLKLNSTVTVRKPHGRGRWKPENRNLFIDTSHPLKQTEYFHTQTLKFYSNRDHLH